MRDTESEVVELMEMARRAKEADVFASVDVISPKGRLDCTARDSAEEAYYRVETSPGSWTVSLVMTDRWLSESIEADLMHSGDSMEELIEEELIELGLDTDVVTVQHFRSDDMFYTFQTPLPEASTPNDAVTWLLAYEAAFRELGDMNVEEES